MVSFNRVLILICVCVLFFATLLYNVSMKTSEYIFPTLNDNLSVFLITFLLGIELSILIFSQFKITNVLPSVSPLVIPKTSFKAMRPAIFLFLFGIDLSISILPLQMEKLYEPIFGLSKELVIALPISLEFLCVGIALLLSGAWLDRRGWVEPFISGILLTSLGGFISWFASDAFQFLISRAILGFGYGLTLLAAQGFVISNTTNKEKAQGLAHLFAGLYSGSICGAATGAIFAERFGYEFVFLAGAIICLSVLLYSVVYLNIVKQYSLIRASLRPIEVIKNSHNVRLITTFLCDKRVLAITLLSSLPASIAVIGFIHFFTPVYLNQNGVSETEIGQVLMLFGICLTLFGPPIGRLIDHRDNKKTPIFIGGLLGCSAFLLFYLGQGVMAVALAVILLGLSNSFILSSQSAYILQLDITKKLGEGKSLGIFRATSRLGQMLGPLIFAVILSMPSSAVGVVQFGVIYLLVVILFQLVLYKSNGTTELSENSVSRESQT